MRKIRLGSLMLAIVILGLVATIVVQERRIARLEANFTMFTSNQSPFTGPVRPPATTGSPSIPALPPPEPSPFVQTPRGPSNKPAEAPLPVSVPSRTLPTPSVPIAVPPEEQRRSLDHQIEFLTRQRERLQKEETEDATAPPPPESPRSER